MATLTERMHRDERLRRLWAILDNQTKLLVALDQLARGPYLGSDTIHADLLELQSRVGRETLQIAARIWQESADDGIEPVNV